MEEAARKMPLEQPKVIFVGNSNVEVKPITSAMDVIVSGGAARQDPIMVPHQYLQPVVGSEELMSQEEGEPYVLTLTPVEQDDDNTQADLQGAGGIPQLDETSASFSEEDSAEPTPFVPIKPNEISRQMAALFPAEQLAMIKRKQKCSTAENMAEKLMQHSSSQLNILLDHMKRRDERDLQFRERMREDREREREDREREREDKEREREEREREREDGEREREDGEQEREDGEREREEREREREERERERENREIEKENREIEKENREIEKENREIERERFLERFLEQSNRGLCDLLHVLKEQTRILRELADSLVLNNSTGGGGGRVMKKRRLNSKSSISDGALAIGSQSDLSTIDPVPVATGAPTPTPALTISSTAQSSTSSLGVVSTTPSQTHSSGI